MCGFLTSYFLCADPFRAFVVVCFLCGIFAGGVDVNVIVEMEHAPTFSACLDEDSVVWVPALVYRDSGMAGWQDGGVVSGFLRHKYFPVIPSRILGF